MIFCALAVVEKANLEIRPEGVLCYLITRVVRYAERIAA